MSLVESLFDRTRATVAGLVVVVIAGLVALHDVPKEAEPDVDVPVLHISVNHTGISPEDADRLIVQPLERQLRTIEGVDEIRSVAYRGGATATLEFDSDFDADKATVLVREQLDIARGDLPEASDEPRIQEINLGLFPLIVVTLSGNAPEREMLVHAKALSEALEERPDILSAPVIGERDEVVEVVIDPLVLQSYGMSAGELIQLVRRSNRLVTAGAVDVPAGRLSVTVPGLFTSLNAIQNLPVKTSGDSVVKLRDVATVRRTLKDRTNLARLNGEPALALAVTKRIGANTLDTIEEINEIVKEAAKTWPNGLTARFSQDRSWRIRTRLAELRNSLIIAVAVVMAIVISTLGFRSGLLVGVAIPGSFLIAVLCLGVFGLSINTAVLYAFVMSVGLLVDGGIVVVENADRLMAEGETPRRAYIRSVRELCVPLATSTATTLAAFVPLLFWPGVVGEYMKFLPLTVSLTLAGAFLMALVFVPVLGRLLRDVTTSSPVSLTKGQPGRLVRGYVRLLGAALRHPGWILGGAVFALVWSFWIYNRHGDGTEFLPQIEPSGALLRVHARGELSLNQKRDLALAVERAALDRDVFESVFLRVGHGALSAGPSGDVIAELLLEFKDWYEHPPAYEVLDALTAEISAMSGIRVEVRPQRIGPRQGKPIRLDFTGASEEDLDDAIMTMRRFLSTVHGVKDVEDSRPPPGFEWRLQIDRAEAARYGVDVQTVGQYAQFITKGLTLGNLETGDSDKEVNIIVRFPERARNLEGLRAIRIQTDRGLVPLSHFATLLPAPRAGDVQRIDGKRARTIEADVERDVLQADVIAAIRPWLVGTSFPESVEAKVRGEDEDRDEARDFLLRAFAAALFIMALILIVQFNSFYSAFLILFAVVLATAGVRLGLLIVDQPFGVVMSGIGIIALAGIVVNNNIILIDTYRRLCETGLDVRTALLQTGTTRLRPVLLTSVTTIAGLMPLVMRIDVDVFERSISIGAPTTQYWVQMSSAVVFGLAFATVLTLFVTPAALMLRANLDAARARDKAAGRPDSIYRAFADHGPAVGVSALTAVVAAWIFIPEVVFVRVIDIGSKQIFEQPPSRWFHALEGAGFWCLIILSAAYAYWRNAHVRVDIIRERLSVRVKAKIEIVGFFVLLLPMCLVMLIAGSEFVVRSFVNDELSGALLGSPTQWIFKAMMLLCFVQLTALGVYVTWKNIRFLRGLEVAPFPPERSMFGENDGPRT
ncbi:MAG: efflux RND transporter permease subunit [Pseudomonadota bacterium]